MCVCVRALLENENIQDLAGLRIEVTVMASYGIISLCNELPHSCFSVLTSMNEYPVIDWGTHERWLCSKITLQMGTCGPLFQVTELGYCQCTQMTPAKLQVYCSASPKPPCSAWRSCL